MRDDEEKGLAIVRPEDGVVFRLVDGLEQQRVFCDVTGVGAKARLWWFVDGAAAGETTGRQPFVHSLVPGPHEIRCVTADGESASVRIDVR